MLERMHDLGHKQSPCIVKFIFFQDNFAETMQEGSHVTRHQPPSTSTDVAFLRLDPCLDGGLKLCSHQVCLSPGSPRSSFFRGMRPLCLHSHAKVFRRFRQCLLVQGSRPLSQVIRQLVFRDGQEVSKSIAEGRIPDAAKICFRPGAGASVVCPSTARFTPALTRLHSPVSDKEEELGASPEVENLGYRIRQAGPSLEGWEGGELLRSRRHSSHEDLRSVSGPTRTRHRGA